MRSEDIDRAALRWRIARRSASGDCVEVAAARDLVAVRHSKRPDAELILFSRSEFAAFLDGARNGEFDDLATPGA